MDEQSRATTADAGRPVLRTFLEAVDDRVLPTAISKPALIELCHTLEDLVLEEDVAGTLITGFQRARFWASERERYAALVADPRRRAIVFTAEDGEDLPGVQRLAVGVDHPVAREWFVIALTTEFSAVLFGRELSRSDATDRAGRQFLTVWSCDPSVVEDLLTVLGTALQDDVPGGPAALAAARAAHPPRDPARGMTQRFATAFFERLELVTQRLQSVQAELDGTRRVVAQLAGDGRRGVPTDTMAGSAAVPTGGVQAGPGRATDHDLRQAEHDGHAAAADDGTPRDDAVIPGSPAAAAVDDAAGTRSTVREALVAHGDPALRGLLEALLRRSGWEVTAAASLEQALEAITMRTFDAVLVDARLVEGDQAAALEQFERVQPDARSRTAFVTDGATPNGEIHGRPVVATPLVWRELEAVLDGLTATL